MYNVSLYSHLVFDGKCGIILDTLAIYFVKTTLSVSNMRNLIFAIVLQLKSSHEQSLVCNHTDLFNYSKEKALVPFCLGATEPLNT